MDKQRQVLHYFLYNLAIPVCRESHMKNIKHNGEAKMRVTAEKGLENTPVHQF